MRVSLHPGEFLYGEAVPEVNEGRRREQKQVANICFPCSFFCSKMKSNEPQRHCCQLLAEYSGQSAMQSGTKIRPLGYFKLHDLAVRKKRFLCTFQ
jgi:hypothetical protein